MNKIKSSDNLPHNSEAARSLSQKDLRTAGHIRLLSSLLDEPAEMVAIALRARLPVIAAITALQLSKAA